MARTTELLALLTEPRLMSRTRTRALPRTTDGPSAPSNPGPGPAPDAIVPPALANHPAPASAPTPTPTPTDPAAAGLLPKPGLLALLDDNDEPFDALARAILSRIPPADAAGRMLAELVVLAAARCRRAARLEPQGDNLPGTDWCRYQSLADRSLRAALADLRRHLERTAPPPDDGPSGPSPAPPSRKRPSPSSKAENAAVFTSSCSASVPPPDAPAPPSADAEPAPEPTPAELAEAARDWRSRIALVRSVSEEWPILLRLRLEVEDVAAWLADGTPEDELMHWYPGLTLLDIAACRACDSEGLCGPFDPADGSYPPGLPVLDDLPGGPSPCPPPAATPPSGQRPERSKPADRLVQRLVPLAEAKADEPTAEFLVPKEARAGDGSHAQLPDEVPGERLVVGEAAHEGGEIGHDVVGPLGRVEVEADLQQG
ncbi:DUF433 domain-containing protein [Tautonia sociabilis]|uniref:DUF433 domain-containing protein n=1 Tax=Tautonia sociabilis TaxID=2080755 RepID=A0A432MNX6_9BACT|nr:DUF433 domain-containing protein [Tautonia sociabilis]